MTTAGRWLTGGDSSDRQRSFSPDGRSIVFSSNRGGNLDLWMADVATGAARRVTHDLAFDWDPAFAPDGKLLWSSNRGGTFELWRAEAVGSGAVELTHAGGGSENPAAYADGRTVAYVSRDPSQRGIHRMRADGSADTLLVAGDLYLPELSPDGRAVAHLDLGGERPVLRLAATADGAPLDFALPLPLSDPGADPDPGRCRWFPDGRSLRTRGSAPPAAPPPARRRDAASRSPQSGTVLPCRLRCRCWARRDKEGRSRGAGSGSRACFISKCGRCKAWRMDNNKHEQPHGSLGREVPAQYRGGTSTKTGRSHSEESQT